MRNVEPKVEQMIDVKRHVRSLGLVLALVVSAGFASAEQPSHLAYAGNQAGAAKTSALELTPPMVQDLRKRYIELRKRAFDTCRDGSGNIDREAQEHCFRDALERLVAAADAPSLTQYHVFLSRIPRPVN